MTTNGDENIEKQAILERFRDVTLTDVTTAVQILEASCWNMEVALDKYLSAKPDDMGTTGNPIEILDSPEKPPVQQSSLMQATSQDSQINTSDNLKLLSWNIDGLDGNQIRERTRYVISLIKERQPDVVFLQEVIDGTFQIFESQLQEYMVLRAYTGVAYFNAMLLRKATIKPTTEF
ncbi:tyrosyl-DNA phosphodiesterase 2 [Exaiptasia diaphana]|uniref:Endonuclease/exonuclease/phosphatase domain-containing protein n=1 Tax=Exaiptasia diaphana TaxID=2652724 RepID=A0A913YTC7_EXADI|nr:tyrosyl-DNA phosphodiesterase 2 [Exaiptasia diaphana]KXJ07441.1 Tyrosyl-DNA phosphodiesterase 2 [Exaiptasia diaphana]